MEFSRSMLRDLRPFKSTKSEKGKHLQKKERKKRKFIRRKELSPTSHVRGVRICRVKLTSAAVWSR